MHQNPQPERISKKLISIPKRNKVRILWLPVVQYIMLVQCKKSSLFSHYFSPRSHFLR